MLSDALDMSVIFIDGFLKALKRLLKLKRADCIFVNEMLELALRG